jgi:hypothetical protein
VAATALESSGGGFDRLEVEEGDGSSGPELGQTSNGLGALGQRETGPAANKIKKNENKTCGLRWLLGQILVGPQREN